MYATKVVLSDGSAYPAVTNIGVRPTVDQNGGVTVESWLLDGFSGDLYGQEVRVEFYHHIRGERQFENVEQLREEVCRNAQQTIEYFEKQVR